MNENELEDHILEKIEEYLKREVKPFGNSGHVIVPKRHIGKKAKIKFEKVEK